MGRTDIRPPSSSGGGGTIAQITSPDSTISVGSSTGPNVTVDLPAEGTPGTYGDASHVAEVTTDAEGRVTAASSVPIALGPNSFTIPGQSYVPTSAPYSGTATTNTRRPVMALGGGGDRGLVTPTNSDVCQRMGFTIPSTGGSQIVRFRFRLRNSNLLANSTQAGAITLGAFGIGIPNVAAENSWTGDFTAVPTTVLAAPGSTELGTSEYVSPWIVPATFQLNPNVFYGLTYGFTCPGVQVNESLTPGWSFVGTGSAAASLLAAIPGTAAQPYVQYLDLRIEYEYSGTNEIGFFPGDSITAGYLNTISGSVASGHMGTDNTYPQQAALRLGHHAMNAGVGGATTTQFSGTPSTTLAWSRFFSPESGYTAFASTPDYMMVAIALNNSADTGSNPLAFYQAGMRSILANATALGIPRAYAGTATTGYTTPVGSAATWMAGQLVLPVAGAFTLLQIATQAPTPALVNITAATNVGTTVTATVSTPSQFYPGQSIAVIGATGGTWPTNANGAWTVASVTATQITFVTTNAPTGAYGGGAAVYPANTPTGPGGGNAQPGKATAWKGSGANNNLFLGTPQNPVAGPFAVSAAVGGGGYVVLVAASGTATAPQGTPVLTASEYYRQAINLWLRSVPPGFQTVIDFDVETTTQYYYPSATGRPEFYNNAGDVHPTGGGMYVTMSGLFVNGILGN